MEESFRFGAVEVRAAQRQVLVDGRPAAVGARAFDLLLALIDRRDRVVSKDELLDAVWPGVVVEENNLQVQVSTIRKLLGAQAIATIPGRGYRFTLPVEGAPALPAPSPDVGRHNLPAALDSFIGREGEIAEIEALLHGARLVTLTGVGGAGKTRLSLQVAARVLRAFPDGAWFVELASLSDERHISHAVSSALGFPEELLAEYVKSRRLLVVLDNCEHLLRGCAEMARRLLQAGPGVKVLASSREALRVSGEASYRVPAMSASHAARLFVDRATAANSAFAAEGDEARAVDEVCQRLDGLPLAIELAAARVRALSVAKIAERLDQRFRLLTGGDPTAMPRQQTLRASIDWSHDLLAAPERIVLRRLAVFAGGWTLEAAEAVAGGGEAERASSVLELLTDLVGKSLVAVDGGGTRYHLLETVREYALERLEESGESATIRTRHLACYLGFARSARPELLGADQARWMARVDEERENLLAAHAWCDRAEGGQELGLELVSSLKQYWINRGLLGLARRVAVEALARAPRRSPARARTLFDAGQVGYFMGLFAEARAELEEALVIARETGDPATAGRVLQPLGMACLGQGDLAAARVHLEEALALARAEGPPRSVASAVNNLAQLHRAEGDLDAAEPLYEDFLALARSLEDRESVAIGLLNLAMTSIDRRRAARAREMLEEALAIAQATGSKPVGQSVLEVCAGLATLREHWDNAARFYGAAEAEASRTGIRRDPADEAFLAPRVALLRSALGEACEAAEAGGRALDYAGALREARDWLATAEASG